MIMIINSLKVENFKRLSNLEINTEKQNVVILSGKNEAGKTSGLDAIAAAIGGKKFCPKNPIKDGENSATVEVQFGAFTVTRNFTPKGSTLEVTANDDHKFTTPQKMLNLFVGKLTWNPSEWIVDAKNQMATLLEVVDFDFNKEAFEKELEVSVIDDPRNSAIDVIDLARKDLYAERRDINRDLKQKQLAVKEQAESLPVGYENIEEVCVGDLIEKEKEIQINIDKSKTLKLELEDCMGREELLLRREENLLKEVEKVQNDIAENKTVIKEIQSAIMDAPRDGEEEIEAIHQKIKIASKINNVVSQVRQLDAMKTEADDLYTKSAILSVRLEAIENYKRDIIEKANMPVDGLSIEDGKLVFKGQPIEQASHARKLEIAIAIGMALNPKLRIIRITDGEKFDSDSMAVIEKMADENDFQIWLEIMDESGEKGFFIQEGELVTPPFPAENTEKGGK